MALYYINKDTNYYNYAVTWGSFHNWGLTYGNNKSRIADNQCCAQTYIELYLLDKKIERITPIKNCIDAMVNSTVSNDWWWVDAFHMAMPVFAKLGAIYNNNQYFERMYDLYNYSKTKPKQLGLYNTTDHLWWRDSTFLPPVTTTSGKQVYWSRGNGWVMAAFARVLDVMPENAPHRSEYLTTFAEMAQALIPIQRTDGFWNCSLADPNDFGGKETSGTALFTYALAWGINKGFLDTLTYKPVVTRAWNAIVNDALHPNGMLGYVQGTGKQPSEGQPTSYNNTPDFEDYGLGAFLLAGSEVYKLAKDSTGVAGLQNLPELRNFCLYPNPFKTFTLISYNLSKSCSVNAYVLDVTGKKVFTILQNEKQCSGNYQYRWNGKDTLGNSLPIGVYLAFLQTNDLIQNRKVEIIR
jgi:rhamnogalacturonyl hydrolase YesR